MAGQSKGVRTGRSAEAEACDRPPQWLAHGLTMDRTVCRHPFSPPCPGVAGCLSGPGGGSSCLTWPFLPAAPLPGRHCSPFAGVSLMHLLPRLHPQFGSWLL